MRILLACHHLINRGGSELCVQELASGFVQLGHTVAVFTFHPGPVAQEIRSCGIAVFTIGDDARIEAFAPEIVHSHHAPILYYLGALKLSCPVVHSILGWIPALEAAPIQWAGVARRLAVSEEVRDRIQVTPFGQRADICVFRNWYDDIVVQSVTAKPPQNIRRVAVVTNHLDDGLRNGLQEIRGAHQDFEWTHFGLPGNSVPTIHQVLAEYDLIITIGRTVLLAGALGKPCLIYDVHGCDGWLQLSNLSQLASYNFSGRLCGGRPTSKKLAEMIFHESKTVDVESVRQEIVTNWGLRGRLTALIDLYAAARETGPFLDESARLAYGRDGRVYSEALLDARHQIAMAQARAEEYRLHGDILDCKLEEGIKREKALEYEIAALSKRIAVLQQENEENSSRAESLVAKLRNLEESVAFKTLVRFRKKMDQLLPRDTYRRLFEQGKQILKR